MSNEYYIKVYDLIFSLVKSNLTGTDQWVDDVEDINIIYLLADNVRFNKPEKSQSDKIYFGKRFVRSLLFQSRKNHLNYSRLICCQCLYN